MGIIQRLQVEHPSGLTYSELFLQVCEGSTSVLHRGTIVTRVRRILDRMKIFSPFPRGRGHGATGTLSHCALSFQTPLLHWSLTLRL